MKIIKKNKRSKKLLLLFAFILATAIGFYGVYAYKTHMWPFMKNESADSKEEKAKKAANNSDAQNKSTKKDIKGGSSSEHVDTDKTTDQIPVSDNLSLNITSLVKDDDDGMISYYAIVSGATSGDCSAVFTNDMGKPVTKTTPVTNGVCSGEVSSMEFDALGEWLLTLRVYSNNSQVMSTKKITIR